MDAKRFRVGRSDTHPGSSIDCEQCGYPIGVGDSAYDLTDGWGPVACSKKCACELQEAEDERMRRMYPANGQTLSCFI